ncbi:MAG: hypothetical protein V4437_00255 [Patescibacteria group bacterium]
MGITFFLDALFDVFAQGTFPIRFFLFALYLAAMLVVVVVYRWCVSKGVTFSPHVDFGVRGIVILALVLLFVVNIFLQVLIFSEHSIPIRSLAYFVDSSEITSTRLTNSNFGKVVIGASLPLVFPHTKDIADTGAALVPYVPLPLIAGESILFLVALLGSLAVYVSCTRGLSYGRVHHVFFFFLYGLVAFLALEKSLDGGLLNDGAYLACMLYASLLFLPSWRFYIGMAVALFSNALLIVVLYVSGMYWNIPYLVDVVQKTLILFIFVGTLYAGGQKLRPAFLTVLLLLSFFCIGVKAYEGSAGEYQYRASPVDAAESFIGLYGVPRDSFELQGMIGRLGVYSLAGTSYKNKEELLERYAISPWYLPISQSTGACAIETSFRTLHFFTLTALPLAQSTLTVPHMLDGTFTLLGRDASGWYRYESVIHVASCVPRPIDVVRESTLLGSENARAIFYDLDISSPSSRWRG